MNLPKYDKLKHFFIGYIISLALPFIGIYALYLCIAVAVGKEIYDKISKKGTPEVLDIVYTVAPCAINYLIFL